MEYLSKGDPAHLKNVKKKHALKARTCLFLLCLYFAVTFVTIKCIQ